MAHSFAFPNSRQNAKVSRHLKGSVSPANQPCHLSQDENGGGEVSIRLALDPELSRRLIIGSKCMAQKQAGMTSISVSPSEGHEWDYGDLSFSSGATSGTGFPSQFESPGIADAPWAMSTDPQPCEEQLDVTNIKFTRDIPPMTTSFQGTTLTNKMKCPPSSALPQISFGNVHAVRAKADFSNPGLGDIPYTAKGFVPKQSGVMDSQLQALPVTNGPFQSIV